jgi:branched-chain amino acid transport system permease protein
VLQLASDRNAALRAGRRYATSVTVAILAVVVTFSVQSERSWLDLCVLGGIYCLIALSTGLAYGQAGVLSLAQGSFALLGGYSSAIPCMRWGWNPYVGLIFAVMVPTVLAYLVGRVIVRLSPLALAIGTLFVGELISVVMANGGTFTGANIGFIGIPSLSVAHSGTDYSLLVWGVVVVVLLMYGRLVGTAEGRALNTLRFDATQARADGLRVTHMLSGVFAASAGVAGVAGWLYVHYFTFVDPNSMGVHWSIIGLLMAVVGGVRLVGGPVLGAVLLTLVNNWLPGADGTIVYGVALAAVLILAPRGLLELDVGRLRPRTPAPPTLQPDAAVDAAEVARPQQIGSR